MTPDPRQIADPFGEHVPLPHVRRVALLGCEVEFRSGSAELLALVDEAYRGLAGPAVGVALQVELRLVESVDGWVGEPPPARMLGGAGLLGVAMDASNLAVVSPESRRVVVQVSRALLRHPYHARYELLEFAVFTLASRVRRLVPLHAGCVGSGGVGALLIGESGAGKSTLSLHALHEGLDFLTEDASFVEPSTLLATGIPNFLHLRFDASAWVDDPVLRQRIEASPVIRRRSGAEKYEVDLRTGWARLATAPQRLAHVVFVSPDGCAGGRLLEPLNQAEMKRRLLLTQPYAAGQPGWAGFVEGCGRLHAWVLKRGSHPRDGAAALRGLLM